MQTLEEMNYFFLNDPHVVVLTNEQMAHGIKVGEARDDYNAAHKAKNAYGYDGTTKEGRKISVAGALGEKAVAVTLDIPWDGSLGNYKAKDVGGYQVRTTSYPDGHLLLHQDDRDGDNDIFVLVTGEDGSYILQGWTIGRHGKLDKYLRKNIERPCCFVPQSQLYSMVILPEDPNEFRGV